VILPVVVHCAMQNRVRKGENLRHEQSSRPAHPTVSRSCAGDVVLTVVKEWADRDFRCFGGPSCLARVVAFI
jgi:hypothetical protein